MYKVKLFFPDGFIFCGMYERVQPGIFDELIAKHGQFFDFNLEELPYGIRTNDTGAIPKAEGLELQPEGTEGRSFRLDSGKEKM